MPLIVNGEIIDDSVLLEERQALAAMHPPAPPDADTSAEERNLTDTARQNVLSRVLLRQHAERSMPAVPEQAIEAALRKSRRSPYSSICGPAQRKAMEDQIKVERLLAQVTRNVKPPKRQEIEDYYRNHPAEFTAPDRVRVRHIVRNVDEFSSEEDALATIKRAAQELQHGTKFPVVADRYSDCQGNGGELGWIQPGEMVDEFDAVVFSMQPGEISQIFRTPFGYHIAQVIERKPAGMQTLPEVRQAISDRLYESGRQRAITMFLQEIARNANIRYVTGRTGESR